MRRDSELNMTGNFASRRGVAHQTLIGVLILLIVLALFMYFLNTARKSMENSADTSCAIAVRKAATATTISDNLRMDITECQPKQITIQRQSLPTDTDAARKAAERTLAESMRSCWRDWGEGELRLFRKEGEYCQACAYISFDQESQREFGTIDDFGRFLATNKSKADTKNYSQVLLGVQNSDANNIHGDLNTLPIHIDTSKQQVVLFYYGRTAEKTNLARMIFGDGVSPAVHGTVIGTVGAIAGGTAIGTAAVATAGTILGGTAAAAVMSVLAVPITLTAAGVGVYTGIQTFLVAQDAEKYYTISTIYLTDADPNNPYVQRCEQAASVTVSP